MINTDHYIRWERVDSVTQTSTGIAAELHHEQLRIDVVPDDVLRIKISRGGVFDEPPHLRGLRRPARLPDRLSGRAGRGTGAVDHCRMHRVALA